MFVALVFAAFGFQAKSPILPPSCSPAFQTAVLSIEEALQSEDFTKAAQLFKLLPKQDVSITWDDSKVPAAYRSSFRKAGEQAIAMWKGRIKGLSFEMKPKGDVRISFEPVLAKRAGTDIPAASVGFFGDELDSPRLDFVIGLKRGSPLKQSEELDVYDEVAYCIGSYLGISDGVFDTYTMGTTDLPRTRRTTVSGTEVATVRSNVAVIEQLREAIKNKTPLQAVKSDLYIDPLTIDGDPAIQGDRVEFNIQVSNRGNGPLTFSMSPDCGCTAVTDPGTVGPHDSRILKVAVDTSHFVTDTTKHVTIYTNDPTVPVRIVTLNVKLKARYRLITPMGETFVVPAGGSKIPVYLIPANGTKLDPVSTSFTDFPGTKAKVTYVPWQGMLADPDFHEGPILRKGYKFVIDVKGSLGPGRNPATLQIYTANPEFPDITISMYGLNGIIAEPDELFMGEVGRVPTTKRITITRPGAPFKILSVETNSPNLKASVVPVPGSGDFTVVVEYDGNGKHGELMAALKIRTNDPKQPLLDIPIRANVQ